MRGNYIQIKNRLYALADKISLQLNSPFTDREDFKNSFTYPANLTVPKEMLNDLGNPQMLQGGERIERFDEARILSDGVPIVDGGLFLKRIRRNLNSEKVTMEAFVGNGATNYSAAVRDLTIRDLKLNGPIEIEGSYTFDPNDWGSYIFSSGNATTDYAIDVVLNGHEYICFPSFRNRQLNVGKNITFGIANYWDQAAGGFRKPTASEISAAHDLYVNDLEFHTELPIAIVPCYYWWQVIKHCFTEFGYSVSGDIFDNDETFRKIYILNSTPIVKPKFYTWSSGAGLYCGRYEEMTTVIDPKNHLPNTRIQDFITDFLQHFNLEADFIDKSVVFRKTELKKSSVDFSEFINPDVEISYEDTTTGVKIEYSYPDDEEYNAVGLDNAKERVTSVSEQFDKGASSGEDGTYALITSLNKLAVIVDGEARDALLDNLCPYESGSGSTISLIYTPPVMRETHYGDPAGTVDCYLPTVDYKPFEVYGKWIEDDVYTGPPGAITFFQTAPQPSWRRVMPEYVSIPPQILFYFGVFNDMGGDEFPFSSHGQYTPTDTTVYAEWHLGIHGEKGIVAYHYGDFLPVFDSRVKTVFGLNLPIHKIKGFRHGFAVTIRGKRYYVPIIKAELPISKEVIFECYEFRT